MALMVNIAQTSLKGKLAASNEFIFYFLMLGTSFVNRWRQLNNRRRHARKKEKKSLHVNQGNSDDQSIAESPLFTCWQVWMHIL